MFGVFLFQAWASDAAASFRHLRGLCELQRKSGKRAQSLSYEVSWLRLNSFQACTKSGVLIITGHAQTCHMSVEHLTREAPDRKRPERDADHQDTFRKEELCTVRFIHTPHVVAAYN